MRTILFDFFGTLVDYSPSRTAQGFPQSDAVLRAAGLRASRDSWLATWDATYAEFEEAARTNLVEFDMAEAVGSFLDRIDLDTDTRFAAEFATTYLDEWNAGVTDIDGLRPMLAELADHHRLAVVSNTNDNTLVPGHLTRLGLVDLLDAVVLSVEVGRRKPHPAIYRTALDRVGAAPGDTLFVGDTLDADYVGARDAGMQALLISEASDVVPDGHRLPSVLDLPDALQRLD